MAAASAAAEEPKEKDKPLTWKDRSTRNWEWAGWVLIDCLFHFLKKTQSVYLLVWICDIFWSEEMCFCWMKVFPFNLYNACWKLRALRSIDKHEKAWLSHQQRYAAAFDAFGSQKMFFSREIRPQNGLNLFGVWLLIEWFVGHTCR